VIDAKTRERFLSKFTQGSEDECWEWQAAIADTGYGLIRFNGKSTGAHRVSYLHFVGDIPDGLWVLHRCDNRRCVNYHHFFLGDREANRADMISKNRQPHGDDHWNSKIPVRDVPRIFTLRKAGMIQKEIGAMFGVGADQICRILNGERRQHL